MQASAPRRANFRRRTVSPLPQSQPISQSDSLPPSDSTLPILSTETSTSSTSTPSQFVDPIPLTSLQTPPQSKGKDKPQTSQYAQQCQPLVQQEEQLQLQHQPESPFDSQKQEQQPTSSPPLVLPREQPSITSATASPPSLQPAMMSNNMTASTLASSFLSPCSSQSSARSSLSMNSPVQIRINSAACSARRSLNYEISMIQEKRFEDERNAINYAEKILTHKSMVEKQTPQFKKQTSLIPLLPSQLLSSSLLTSSPAPAIATASIAGAAIADSSSAAMTPTFQLTPSPYKLPMNTLPSILSLSNNKIASIFPQSPQPSPNRSAQAIGQNTPTITGILKKRPAPPSNSSSVLRSESEERLISPFSEDSMNSLIAMSNTNNNKNNNRRLSSSQSQLGSKERTASQSSRTILDVNMHRENFTWSDRKSLSKITRENTERNSVIQPVENIGEHESQLQRCTLHTKRVKDYYCVDDSCPEKHKFGCVLCFSSHAGSVHSFHQFRQIASMRQLNERIRKNRRLFEDFITQRATALSEAILASVSDNFSKNLKESLLEYAATLEDKEFIGYNDQDDEDQHDYHADSDDSDDSKDTTTKKEPNEQQDNEHSNRSNGLFEKLCGGIPKETAVSMYLSSIERQAKDRLNQVTSLWINQSYLGTFKQPDMSAIFQNEKRRNLLTFARCFHTIKSEVIAIYLSSAPLKFESAELENLSSLKLHFFEDDVSRGLYQIGDSNSYALKSDSAGSTQSSSGNAKAESSAAPLQSGQPAIAGIAGLSNNGSSIGSAQNAQLGNGKKLKNGRGIQCFKSGSIFEGYFKNDMKFGEGKMISFNREEYVGNFKRNLRSGEGQLTYANGDVYTGSFSNDQCHGAGKRYYASEDVTYVGQWVKNQRHGKGSLFKNGKVIESGVYIDDHLKSTSQK